METNEILLIESLINNSEFVIDIKTECHNKINNLNNLLEDEKAILEDCILKEEALSKDILSQAKLHKLLSEESLKNEKEYSLNLEDLIQEVQSRIAVIEEENDKNNNDLKNEKNIINLEDHKDNNTLFKNLKINDTKLSERIKQKLTLREIDRVSDLIKFNIYQVLNIDSELYFEIYPELKKHKLSFAKLPEDFFEPNLEICQNIKEDVHNVLETLTRFEKHLMIYQYGLSEQSDLTPGRHYTYKSCYTAQYDFPIHDEITGLVVPRYSYTSVRKYSSRARRKLKHPTRTRIFHPHIVNFEKLALKMNCTIGNYKNIEDAYHISKNPDISSLQLYDLYESKKKITIADLPDHNNRYMAFIFQDIFGYSWN